MAFISIGQLNRGGTVPDHPATELPPHVFNDAEDVDYTTEGLTPMVAEIPSFGDMEGNPLQVRKVKLGAGVDALVYMTQMSMYMIYNFIHTNITRSQLEGGAYSAIDALGWNDSILHGIPIFNNGNDIPQQIDPSEPNLPAKNLENWDVNVRAEVLRPYKNFLIALRVKTGGGPYDKQTIIWSAPADPGSVPPSWDYTDPATQAGLFTFSETDDRLVDGKTLGDEFIVYKENSIYAMRFIGGTFIFSIKRRPGDIGLLSDECVVDFPGGHFFVGQDDFYQYNGAGTPSSVGTGRVRRRVFGSITQSEKNKVFVEHDAARRLIYVFYPAEGSLWANKAAVWNYEINTWTFRNVPQVSGATFGATETLLQNSWDDFVDIWGGDYNVLWSDEVKTWETIPVLWGGEGDNASWDSDATTWGSNTTWNAQTASDIWDEEELEPVLESLVMASHITSTPEYNAILNRSVADGITWIGDNPYPPLWLIPITGEKMDAVLTKTGIAFIGQDTSGNIEVNRTVRKILSECYPEVLRGKIKVRFGTQMTPTAPVEWDEEWIFDPDVDDKIDPFISGKYLAIEFSRTGEAGNDWLLSGYGLEVNQGGRY